MDLLNLPGDESSDSSSSSDSDSDDDQDVDMFAMCMLMLAMECFITCNESFQPIELSRENQRTVNHNLLVSDVIGSMAPIPQHFKDLTNFWPEEFNELCRLVCPVISSNARITGVSHILSGRPPKLTPEERLLSFILYMKHDNTIYVDAQRWNWSRTSVSDDSIFVASCVNEALELEIRWPGVPERVELGRVIPQLPGCIGFVDGTLCRVRRPFENQMHSKWFQGRKKMYCLNSTVLVDHNGLFIHVDPGYPGSFHDSQILKTSMVERFWRRLFTHTEGYSEYVLGDSGYMGAEKYVMRGFSKTEIRMLGLNRTMVKIFNKMHSGYRVKVEWGIGGLKMKWKRLGKRFDLSKRKFSTTFRAAALLTNFLHRRRRDMHWEVVGPRGRPEDGGWHGDY